MVDDLIDDNEQDIRTYVIEELDNNVAFAQENGNLEILELNLERLEPREIDD